MTAAFEQVRALIPRLDPDERTKIKLLLTKHSGIPVKASKVVNELSSDWLLQGILHELKQRGQPAYIGSMGQVRALASGYEIEAQFVRQHFEEQIARRIDNPTRTHFLTLGNISAQALARYFEPKMTIGLKPLLRVVGRTPEALESSFPGYLASGMLHKLIGAR